MMISDNLNWYNHGNYTEMTDPSLDVYVTDEYESKLIIMHEILLDNSYTDVSKSERNIVNKTLSTPWPKTRDRKSVVLFWEEKFTGKENMFLAVNIKNCGHRNVRKHKEIRGSEKYITLDIPSKFDSLDKMKITSSESKVKLERSGKGLITSLGFKTKARSQK